MSREDPQLKLRLPEELRARLAAEAKANRRSVNAEIVYRLWQTLAPASAAALTGASILEVKLPTSEVTAEQILKALDDFRSLFMVADGTEGSTAESKVLFANPPHDTKPSLQSLISALKK